ncbi:helix-turn-helix domain-containing protein [Bradyrhizobium sp. BEA-2-5]|uniref:helix-turn-helix domain-containing protein n=1 Tax=Bradyrhizobium TaxID=374 RepID=UPI0009B7B75E|nr:MULTISPECIES: helix-turn-helix domain-containing protein [Bradyrhizobium]WOH80989.1 helix-turn-helix domain-containing protein [Bradyrhizobium sp. BEA-2-5]
MSKGHRLPTVREMKSAQQREICCDLVGQAEKLALSRPDQPPSISDICRALTVSERTLRKAFNEIHGVPPCRRLRMLRLLHARKMLLAADRELTTVTKVAIAFGFSELGRFSVEYRSAFGERPSQTLNLSCMGADRDVSATSRAEFA